MYKNFNFRLKLFYSEYVKGKMWISHSSESIQQMTDDNKWSKGERSELVAWIKKSHSEALRKDGESKRV